MKRMSMVQVLLVVCLACLVCWLAAGCGGLGGTTHEQSPSVTINNYLPTPGAVAKAEAPREIPGVPGAQAAGGKSEDRFEAHNGGGVVVIFSQGNNPASAGSNLPTDVARGWLQNALQGSTVPIGQQPIVSQSGISQQFANGTGEGSTPSAGNSGAVTGGAQSAPPSTSTSSTSTHNTTAGASGQ